MNRKIGLSIIAIGTISIVIAGCSNLKKDLGPLKQSMKDSLINNCISNPNNNAAKDKTGYCRCFAEKYVRRFSSAEIKRINQIVVLEEGKKFTRPLLQVLLSPEQKVCRDKFAN